MLSLADVPLLLPDGDGELLAFLERFQSLDDLHLFGDEPMAMKSPRTQSRADNAYGVGLPLANWPDPPPPRINSLWWPTGASRWARGLFIADGASTALIVQAAGGSLGSPSNTPLMLRMGDSTSGSVLETSVYLLPPRPITAGVDRLVINEQLWLLPIVDVRYWWQFKNVGDANITSSTTWADLYTTLGGVLGVTIAADTVAAAYLGPDPVELSRDYDNAALLLDAVALSVGQRLVRSPTGNVTAQNVATANAQYVLNVASDAWTRPAGDDFTNSRGHIPANLAVTFPRYRYGVPYCNGQREIYSQSAPTTLAPVTPGTTKIIHSSVYADFTGGSGSADNDTKLSDLSKQVRDDYYGWLGTQFDLTFNGVKAWFSSGFDNWVEWSFGRQLDGGQYLAHTRVQSMPYDFGVEQQLSQDPAITPLSHFEIGKADADLVPGSHALVSVWDTTPGAEADTGRNVRAYPWGTDTIPAGTKVLLFWHCKENVWYATAMQPGTPLSVTLCLLTTALSYGGIAKADPATFNVGTGEYDAVPDSTIAVYDPTGLDLGPTFGPIGNFGPSSIGSMALVVQLADRPTINISGTDYPAYCIIWIEERPLFIHATLSSSFDTNPVSPTYGRATTNPFLPEPTLAAEESDGGNVWQGSDILDLPEEVWDPLHIFEDLTAGDEVNACWDDRFSIYRVITGKQTTAKPRWWYATTDHTLASQAKSKLHKCSAQECDDSLGNNPHGGVFDLFFHSDSDAKEPNVEQGAVGELLVDVNGRHVNGSGGYLDDARGTQKIWKGAVAVPHGWHVCDGNGGTDDLRDKFVVGVGTDSDFDGQGHGTAHGNVGGTKNHNHPALKHKRMGSTNLITEETELKIRSDTITTNRTAAGDLNVYFPGFLGAYSGYTGFWAVHMEATNVEANLSGSTDAAVTGIKVYDPQAEANVDITVTDGSVPPAQTEHDAHVHFGGTGQYCVDAGDGTTWAIDGGSVLGANQLSVEYHATDGGAMCGFDQYVMDHKVWEPWADPGDHSKGVGHIHAIHTSATIELILDEPPPGHRHTFGLTVTIPPLSLPELPPYHLHTIYGATLEGAMWIEDRTHTSEARNFHYHGLILDDHTISSANHIPPYYASLYIERVN